MEHPLPEGSRSKQPNSRHCFACGLENPYGLSMRFYSLGPGRVEADYVVPDHYQGYPGVVHGGIVAAMLDEILGRVAMTHDPNHFMVTAKMEVRYRQPVPVGEALRLEGILQRDRGRIITAKAWLTLPDGSLAAEAEATLADLPDRPSEPELLSELGWAVYPDKRPD